MAERVLPFGARTQAFVYELPHGEKRLIAQADFDDRAVWAVKSDFDGREEMTFHAPGAAGPWVALPAHYRGTSRRLFDLHTASASLAAGPIDLAALLRHGIAASALVRGPRLGADLMHLQPFGQNTPVWDVGRVDQHGIAWMSGVTARRVHRYNISEQPLRNGDTVTFRQSEFGVPGNINFEMDVFAPEVTPLYGLPAEAKRRAIAAMQLTVESDFFPAGERTRPLQYVHNVGPNGNNFRIGFDLADPSLFQQGMPATGVYPVRFKKGNDVIASFNLDWRANE